MINTCLFNAEESEPCLLQFHFEMNAKNVAKDFACFKIPSKPSGTDLVITNGSSNFQKTKAATSAAFLDFHKIVVRVLKHAFHRSAYKKLVYRNYKNYDRVIFKK